MTRRLSKSAVIAAMHVAALYLAVVACSACPESAYPGGYRPNWIVVLFIVQLRLPGLMQWVLAAIVSLTMAGLSTQPPGLVVGVIGLQLFVLQYSVAHQLEQRCILFSMIVGAIAAAPDAAFVLADAFNPLTTTQLNWQQFLPAVKTGLATTAVIFPWIAVYSWWVSRGQQRGSRAAVIRNAWPMLSGR